MVGKGLKRTVWPGSEFHTESTKDTEKERIKSSALSLRVRRELCVKSYRPIRPLTFRILQDPSIGSRGRKRRALETKGGSFLHSASSPSAELVQANEKLIELMKGRIDGCSGPILREGGKHCEHK